ncbi:MAG TPA: hypothetical protein VEX16_02200 [Methyloceanibacter sp.]|nr:hypothetical protein [Methyloceanibacter sp.]
MLELKLRERGGPIAVAPDDWLRLQMENSIGALHRHGILRVERTAAAILLFPSAFVGELRAPGLRLSIRAKDEAFCQAMLRLASDFDGRRVRHHEALSSEPEGEDLASPYVRALSDCLEEGLPWHYERCIEATSRPRGKPQFSRTIADFVSRGVLHRIVATRQDRHQLDNLSSVVWAAYRCLPGSPGATTQLVRRAAMLVEALDTKRELTVPEAISIGAELLLEGDALSPTARGLLTASLVLLERADRGGTSLVSIPSGAAQFVNLERMWERAVATLVRTWVSVEGAVTLHGLSGKGVHLFGECGPVIDPDVVVFDESGAVSLVTDAKYKILGEKETQGVASDLYQLTCYIERIQAPTGMLVYVGTSDSVVELGSTLSGLRVLAIRISPASLLSDGHQALSRLLTAAPVPVETV